MSQPAGPTTHTTTVSFVISVYQQAEFAPRTVRSAVEQDIADIEVVVVDDGSTDGTADAVAAIDDPRVRLIRQDNQGPSGAFNTGLHHCRGEYVALLGGDDMALPHRARRQRELLERGAADILFSLPILIDEKDRPLRDEVFPVFSGGPVDALHENAVDTLFSPGNFLCAPTAFFRRSTWEQVGDFKLGLIQLQDYEFWVRAAWQGCRFLVSEEPVSMYRLRNRDHNLSTASHDGRTAVEHGYVMETYFRGRSLEEIARYFPRDVPAGFAGAPHELALAKALIYMRHGRRDVREIGYRMVIDLLDTPAAREAAATLGLTQRALFDLMLDDDMQRKLVAARVKLAEEEALVPGMPG